MRKQNNILLVANWDSNVGYAWWLMENFWITIADHLKSKGIDSFLIYPKITGIPETIAATNISVIQHDFQDTSIKGLTALRRIIKQNNIRHIYLTDKPAFSWFYFILRFWGVKTILVHDHTPGERTVATGIKFAIKSFIQRIPLFTADQFIAVTEYVYNRHLKVSCIPESKCNCAPNGIFPIDLEAADFDYTHKEFNIPKDKTIVATTGRATYYKGIDFFIECANELINNQGRKEFFFLYCGDGPDIVSFKQMVKSYNLLNNFIFAGRRSDIRNILPSCDIGLHCATGEVGYSLSILEYMSAGLVTVVPDNPSTSLAIKHGINGYTYTPHDTQSAVENILISSEIERTGRITKKAIDDVNTKYNIDITNESLRKIIDQNIH